MFDKLRKKLEYIIEESGSSQIVIFTNHLKIDGFVYKCDGACKDTNDCILTLTDAVVCRLDEYCTCDTEGCECNDFVCFKYDWLHINMDKIVSFSILK